MQKTSFLLLILVFSSMSFSVFGQQVTLNLTNVNLENVLTSISGQTDYTFSYNTQSINLTQKTSIKVSDLPLEEALQELFSGTKINYEVLGSNKILLTPKREDQSNGNHTQLKTVRGTVTDESGLPLPGATIMEKGTSNGVSADFDGNYSIAVPTNAQLLISYLGYQPKEVEVNGQSEIDVTLITDANELNEVVVVGYGTQKKKDLTGAISTLDGGVLENINGTQLAQELQGQIAGVTITRNSSLPGASADITIRGITTIGNSAPLIIVDGVPYTNINDVTSNDIENITVLKDAASASIYGSRAAAGVILITTKSAQKGKTSIEIGTNTGFERIPTFPKSVHTTRYLEMANETMWNDSGNAEGGEYPLYSEDDVKNWMIYNQTDPNNYPVTDWSELLLRKTAPRQRHFMTLSHGSENVRSRVSINYEDTEALFEKENYERVIARANNRFNFGEKLTADFDVSFNRSLNNRPLTRPLNAVHKYAPIYAAVWEDGRIAGGKDGSNRYAALKYGGDIKEWNNKINGRVSLKYEPIEGLTFTGTISPYYHFGKQKNFTKKLAWYDADDPTIFSGYISGHDKTSLYEMRSETQSLTKQFVANWEKSFRGHHLNLMAGYEDYTFKTEILNAQSEDFELDGFPYLDLGNQNFMLNSGNAYESAYQSLFGRITYDYNDTYYVQANFRRDGSSRFHPDHRWAVFPSISAGWTISQESFMENIALISLLKLRGSFGTLGNERIGYYPYQSSINYSSAPFYQGSGGIIGKTTAAQTAYAIQDISWETTESWNVGIDGSFFKNKLSITGDYYVKKTKDMLLELEVPDYLGFDNPNQNTGTMSTKGWELVVNWRDQVNEDFSYSASFNISDFKSTMGNLGGTVFMGDKIIREGSEFNEWFGYVSEGIYQSQEEVDNNPVLHQSVQPGDIRYKDISGPDGTPDGVITPEYDKVLLGGSLPRFSYGANLNVVFKNFDLSMMFQGVANQTARIAPEMIQPLESWWRAPSTLYDSSYWSVYNTPEENRDARFPRLSYQSAENNNYEMSDFWLFDGGYFRLKNITLGYNLPQSVLDRINVEKLRIYVSGTDLFSISDFPEGYDPESNYNTYISSVFSLGFNINF